MLEADIFAMPSWAEPSAAVYAEAAGHGLPVVATKVGGTAERVLDGTTGYLVHPGDVNALTQRLCTLMDNPVMASTMGAAGHAFATGTLTWPTVAETIMRHLHEPAAQRFARPRVPIAARRFSSVT
jgi:glycosyltransferase involved in cell wall biosynthesis